MARAWWGVLAGACVASCGRGAETPPENTRAGVELPARAPAEEGALRLEPETLTLPRAFVGHAVTVPLRLSLAGQEPLAVALRLAPPFSLDARALVLEPGQPRTVTLTLEPSAPGALEAELTVVSMQPDMHVQAVPVHATVEPEPACAPSAPCRESHFDAASGQCVEASLPGCG